MEKKDQRKRWIFALPLFLFAVLVIFLLKGLGRDPNFLPSQVVGKKIPEFNLPSLLDASQVTSAQLVGKPFLLNIWATWCPSCRVEHPSLLKLKESGVIVVGVDYKDEKKAAEKYLELYGNPYSFIIFDELGSLVLDLGVYGAPETFFVDKSGIIRYRHVGVIDDQVWVRELRQIYSEML